MGSYLHITSRGNNKEPIFLDDDDRRTFLHLLGRFANRYGWVGLAYCLMTNHYHLVVHLPVGDLSPGMQLLNSGYACRFNRRHGRIDHVFKQRFASEEIENEAHLLEAFRYVVLNPVRAGLCDAPEDWPWSSYRACAGLSFGDPFVRESALLRFFGSTPTEARRVYRAFVALGHVPGSDTGIEAARAAAAPRR